MDKFTRINKYIASTSRYSRREADAMIEAGRVALNGVTVREKGVKVDEENDAVSVDGIFIEPSLPEIFKFYKPRRVLTAYGDGRGKDTLDKFSLFAARKLPYSGRLDYESEGLLIFTNDGELVQRMQRPENKVEKEYLVTVDRMLTDEEMREFSSGLETAKGTFKLCGIFKAGKREYRVIVTEGKKRQVRNMFAYFGSTVKRLERTRIGPVSIGELKPGEHARLTKKEIKELYKCTGLR